jgi:hypothetical protein
MVTPRTTGKLGSPAGPVGGLVWGKSRNAVLSGGNELGGAGRRDAGSGAACGQWRRPLLPAWKRCAGNVWCQGPAAPSGWPTASLRLVAADLSRPRRAVDPSGDRDGQQRGVAGREPGTPAERVADLGRARSGDPGKVGGGGAGPALDGFPGSGVPVRACSSSSEASRGGSRVLAGRDAGPELLPLGEGSEDVGGEVLGEPQRPDLDQRALGAVAAGSTFRGRPHSNAVPTSRPQNRNQGSHR